MIGQVLFSRLTGQTAAGSRVYPTILPQSPTFPAVTYQQISAVKSHAMGQDTPLTRLRVQVDCWAKSHADVRALAAAVAARLSRFKGEFDSVDILDCLLENEIEGYEATSQTRRIIQEYTVFIRSN
jgi:hypothetical protein